MVPPANEPFAYDLIHDQGYRYLLVADPTTADLGLLSRWRWVGALGPHMYAIADLPSGLSRSQFVATNDARPPSGSILVKDRFQMPCGRRVRVPHGEKGTWIRFEGPLEGVRLTLSDKLVPVPARTAVFIATDGPGRRLLTISCTGRKSLAVAEIVDAGLPG
jgi:hypothetical protein